MKHSCATCSTDRVFVSRWGGGICAQFCHAGTTCIAVLASTGVDDASSAAGGTLVAGSSRGVEACTWPAPVFRSLLGDCGYVCAQIDTPCMCVCVLGHRKHATCLDFTPSVPFELSWVAFGCHACGTCCMLQLGRFVTYSRRGWHQRRNDPGMAGTSAGIVGGVLDEVDQLFKGHMSGHLDRLLSGPSA